MHFVQVYRCTILRSCAQLIIEPSRSQAQHNVAPLRSRTLFQAAAPSGNERLCPAQSRHQTLLPSLIICHFLIVAYQSLFCGRRALPAFCSRWAHSAFCGQWALSEFCGGQALSAFSDQQVSQHFAAGRLFQHSATSRSLSILQPAGSFSIQQPTGLSAFCGRQACPAFHGRKAHPAFSNRQVSQHFAAGRLAQHSATNRSLSITADGPAHPTFIPFLACYLAQIWQFVITLPLTISNLINTNNLQSYQFRQSSLPRVDCLFNWLHCHGFIAFSFGFIATGSLPF